MSPLHNMNMTPIVLEDLQKSPIPPNTIAVDVYEAPFYQSTSVARDMHQLTRFGKTSNMTVLLEDTSSRKDYVQGIFAWAIFMMVLFVVWSATLLICKLVGQYRVGFVSGWPPLDPSVKHDKRIRRRQEQHRRHRHHKKHPSTNNHHTNNSQRSPISAMDENEGNHDPDESHYGSSIFVSSKESSSSVVSYSSSSTSTSFAEVSSSVEHLSMGHVSLNSGRELDLHNVFIDTTMTQQQQQQQQQQPFPTPTSGILRQASQGDANLETFTCMQPSPGESALSQPSPSANSSPPPSVQLSARIATRPSNHNNNHHHHHHHNTNHYYLDGPPPKLPFMVRDETTNKDETENKEYHTLRTPPFQQKRTRDGGVSSPYQPQQPPPPPQIMQSLKHNSIFMSNPTNVSLLISSMKEESVKKRNLHNDGMNSDNNNHNDNNNNNNNTAAAETTITAKGQQQQQQEIMNESSSDQHDDGMTTPEKFKSAITSTIPTTSTIISNDIASDDQNGDGDDITATTNSEEGSDFLQPPTILPTNQGGARSPKSVPSQPSAAVPDTTPIATHSELVQLASQRASPKNIALLPLSVQQEIPSSQSIHNSNVSSSMSSSISANNKSEQQIIDQIGAMAPLRLPTTTDDTHYTPFKEDAVSTFDNTMGDGVGDGVGGTDLNSPATSSAAEQLEFERIRSEAQAATQEIMIDHLNTFLHETPNGTYEEWIADLHPENAQSKRNVVNGKRIDHRFYMRDSHHRNIWNDSIVPGEQRKMAPERSYCDRGNGGDMFEDEPLLATMSTKTLPYDNVKLDGKALERARIRRNHFLFASRVIALVSCIGILISSFIFLFKGVQSLAQSLDNVESGIVAVEDVTKDGISILDKYFYKAKEARTYADDFFTDGSTFCLEKRDEAVRICDTDNAFDLDGTSTESECKIASIQKSIESLQNRFQALKSDIFEEARNLQTDLDEILDTADEVKDSLNGFNWAWGLSTTFAVTLDVIVCAIMYNIIQTWNGNEGCMSKWYMEKCFIPLFVLNMIFMWIFASLFVSGAVITSDFCYDSPDSFIKQVLEKKQEDFSPYTANLLTYYIDGCADLSNPVKIALDNLGNEAIKIAYIITAGHTVLSNLEAIDSDVVTNFCGNDVGPFEVATTFFDATFHALLEIVEDVRELMFCGNWNPIYTSIVHDAICYEGVTGLSWIYSSLSTIGFFGMVILTFRYVLWPDTLEEESLYTPPGRDNDDDIADDNFGKKWMSSLHQRCCCARKSRIPRTVIMSSRASNSPSSKTNTV